MKLKIKKGDMVQVIAGAEKGKKGEVIEVNPLKMLVKINGIRIQTHYDKKESTLKKLEGYMDYSNIKLVEKTVKKTAKKKVTSSKNA